MSKPKVLFLRAGNSVRSVRDQIEQRLRLRLIGQGIIPREYRQMWLKVVKSQS